MLTQNQLKSIFAEYGLAPLKRLGQNYLIDGNIKDKIISEVSPSKEDTILEIGPGQVLKGLSKKIDPKLEVKNFGTIQDLQPAPVS